MYLTEVNHGALSAQRERAYLARWEVLPGQSLDQRHRVVMRRAISNLPHAEADAKDRLLLHYIECSMDAARRQSCTASIATISAHASLSALVTTARLAKLQVRGLVEEVPYGNALVGRRVIIDRTRLDAARAELQSLWAHCRPEYTEWLTSGPCVPVWKETRVLWLRHIWETPLAAHVKALAVELSQFVNASGDAPLQQVTQALLAARTAYSVERVRQALRVLESARLIDTRATAGRTGGLAIRLRLRSSTETDSTAEKKVGSIHTQPYATSHVLQA